MTEDEQVVLARALADALRITLWEALELAGDVLLLAA